MAGEITQTSADVVRRTFEDFVREGVRPAGERHYTEDVVFVDIPDFPGGDVHYGREATIRHLEEFFDAWEGYEFTLKDVVGDGERAAANFVLSLRGRSSGAETAIELWHVALVRDGRIARVEAYRERAAAMAALRAEPSGG